MSIENTVSGSQETALMNATSEPRQGLHTTFAAEGVRILIAVIFLKSQVINSKIKNPILHQNGALSILQAES